MHAGICAERRDPLVGQGGSLGHLSNQAIVPFHPALQVVVSSKSDELYRAKSLSVSGQIGAFTKPIHALHSDCPFDGGVAGQPRPVPAELPRQSILELDFLDPANVLISPETREHGRQKFVQ